MDCESLEQLVAERRGYKFLSADGVSPYQKYHYELKSKKAIATVLDSNKHNECGAGWNLATLKWIADNCLRLDGIIVEFSIPDEAEIVVPYDSDGKFRTDIIQKKRVLKIEKAYPALKGMQSRLEKYKPINPITAEKMPPENKIKNILAQVGDQVWNQVGNQVWNQVRDQVGDQVWNQVRDQVRDQVWNQVRDQVGNQVWNQVRDQVGVIAYYAVKLFMNLDCEHPAFDLIRLGIIVVRVFGKFKVFGKNGKYLGEF